MLDDSPPAKTSSDRRSPVPGWRRRFARLSGRDIGYALAILASGLLTLAAAVSIATSVQSAVRAVWSLGTSRRIIEATTTLLATTERLESNQRGYVLTGQPEFLKRYEGALDDLGMQRARLRTLMSDPARRARFADLDALIVEKIDITRRTLDTARAGDAAAARAAIATGNGARAMDRAHRAAALFIAAENLRIARSRSDALAIGADVKRNVLSVGILLLAAGAIALVSVRRTRMALTRRSDATARARRRFRATFDQAAVGIAHLAPDGVILRVNAKLCAITGYSSEELVGHWFEAFTHRDDIPRELARRRALLSGEGAHYDSEYRCVRADGSPLWISVSGSLVRDRHGDPEFFVCVVMDIGERKRTEAQLQAGEAQYRAIHDSAVEAIAVIDQNGTIQSVNAAAQQIFGYASEDMVGHNVSMLMPGTVAHEHDQYLDRYRRTGRRAIIGIGREVKGRRKDGSIFPLDLSVAEWRRDGQTFFTGMMRDISERKRAEAKIAEGEARFRLTQQAVDAGNWETDLRTNRSTLSGESLRLFGFPGEGDRTFEQGELGSLLDPSDAAKMNAQFRRALASGKRLDAVIRINLADGASRWVQTIGQAQYDDDGNPVRMIGLNIDVSEQRQVELALRESQARLRSLQEEFAHLARVNELGELAAAIAHEINQPLAAIANYLNTGRYALAMVAEAKGYAAGALTEALEVTELAAGQALRAGEIVRRLRAFVAKDASVRRAEKIDEIVDAAMALALVDAQLAGIIVERHRGAAAVCVDVESIQIQQVLVNLLRNAIDALLQLPESDVRQLSIKTKTTAGGKFVEVAVNDSGPGIPPDVLARLFEPFVTSKAHGMGMGLSLSRRLIEAHGGRIDVSSTPGKGATFRFTLPVMTAEQLKSSEITAPLSAGPLSG